MNNKAAGVLKKQIYTEWPSTSWYGDEKKKYTLENVQFLDGTLLVITDR